MSEFNKSLMDEIVLEVMKFEGIDTFIYHINGKVTTAALVEIEKQLLEYEEDLLTRGNGYYKLSCCCWNTGEWTDYGQCAYPAYWDIYVEECKPLEGM